MDRYSEYKPSSIQWLRELPSHWEERKVKYCFIERSEKNHPNEPVLCATQSQGVIPQSLYQNRVVAVNKGFEELKFVRVGHFVISLRSFEGGIEYAFYQGIISAAYTILEPIIKENVQYFRLLFKSHFFIQLLQTCVTGIREGQNINYQLLGRKFIPIPPLAEQKKIVNFLNNKISRIDEFLLVKEEQIKLLQELKESEIANVITRGLNPNVKMKDSRNSLFGVIPVHWEERKLKYCFSERVEKNHPEEPILCATQSQGVIPQSMYQNRVVVVNKGFEGLKFVRAGDFVISLRSFEGGIEYAYYQGIISAAYTILRPIAKENTEYFKLLFKCYPFIQLLQTCVTGIREGQNINYQVLGRKIIPIPPLEEQLAIVSHIEKMCSKVNSLIIGLKAEIEYLKEYKQSLIADCVTGQINVQQQ